MVENTTYITKAEPAEQQEKRAEEILRDMLSSPLFFMCAVLVTLNAVISVIVSGMNGFGDVYGGAVTFTSWAFQMIFEGKMYVRAYNGIAVVLSGVFGTVTAVSFWLLYIGTKKRKLCGTGFKTMKIALLCRTVAFAVTAAALFGIIVEFIVYEITTGPSPTADIVDYIVGYLGYGVMFIGGIVSALSAVCCFMMVRSLHNSEKAVRGDGALRTIPRFATCMYLLCAKLIVPVMLVVVVVMVPTFKIDDIGKLWVFLPLICKAALSALFAACTVKFNKIADKAKV